MAPPHARSRRRQQQQQQRPRPQAPATTNPVETLETETLDDTPTEVLPVEPTIAPIPAATPPATPRRSRRVLARAEPEPVDYSRDYAFAGRDLKIIAVLAVILTASMIALRLSGLI